ncbi:MAG TPA: FixH family protein [Azospirillaceae bacterium]|nr:FixH family protein [Azospirillaceae bacterium]
MAVIAKSRRSPGWYIPWLFVAFFLIVIGANATMMFFAFSTWTGLETEDHFRKGIQYNQDLEGARAQRERGWHVGFDFKPQPGLRGEVEVVLKDKYENFLSNAQVTVRLARPTAAGHDQTVPLEYKGEGRYAAPVQLPLVGQWDMHLNALHESGDYQKSQRILVKE